MSMTISEAIKKIDELNQRVESFQAEIDDKNKKAETEDKEKEAKIKTAQAKTKKFAEAMKKAQASWNATTDEENEKDMEERVAETKKNLEQAMSIIDNKGSKYKSSSDNDDDESNDSSESEDDNEKKAMKAELKILHAEVSRPRMQYLEASYKGRIDDKILLAYKASWSKMSVNELDSEILKIKPFAAAIEIKMEADPISPISFTQPLQFNASLEKDEYIANLEKKSVSELLSGGIA